MGRIVNPSDVKDTGVIDYRPHGKCAQLFKMETTLIQFDQNDFFQTKGRYSGGRTFVDSVSEASGVNFVAENCTVTTEEHEDDVCGRRTVYIGRAQGKIRQIDGSYRMSSVAEYEFDPVARVYDNFKINKKEADPWDPNNALEVKRQTLEMIKVARQRANTGARLRVIRELLSIPSFYTEQDINTVMCFGRVVQNTDYILETPAGQILATCNALGFDPSAIFGSMNKHDLDTVQTKAEETLLKAAEKLPPVESSSDKEEHRKETAVEKPEKKADKTEFEELDDLIEKNKELLNIKVKSGNNPYEMAKKAIESGDPDAVANMTEKVNVFIEKCKSKKAAKETA